MKAAHSEHDEDMFCNASSGSGASASEVVAALVGVYPIAATPAPKLLVDGDQSVTPTCGRGSTAGGDLVVPHQADDHLCHGSLVVVDNTPADDGRPMLAKALQVHFGDVQLLEFPSPTPSNVNDDSSQRQPTVDATPSGAEHQVEALVAADPGIDSLAPSLVKLVAAASTAGNERYPLATTPAATLVPSSLPRDDQPVGPTCGDGGDLVEFQQADDRLMDGSSIVEFGSPTDDGSSRLAKALQQHFGLKSPATTSPNPTAFREGSPPRQPVINATPLGADDRADTLAERNHSCAMPAAAASSVVNERHVMPDSKFGSATTLAPPSPPDGDQPVGPSYGDASTEGSDCAGVQHQTVDQLLDEPYLVVPDTQADDGGALLAKALRMHFGDVQLPAAGARIAMNPRADSRQMHPMIDATPCDADHQAGSLGTADAVVDAGAPSCAKPVAAATTAGNGRDSAVGWLWSQSCSKSNASLQGCSQASELPSGCGTGSAADERPTSPLPGQKAVTTQRPPHDANTKHGDSGATSARSILWVRPGVPTRGTPQQDNWWLWRDMLGASIRTTSGVGAF